MSKTYRSAQGRPVNLDAIIVLNEDEIALGNMNVNARGDELGPGGKVVKTRNQVMEEYYKLNTPVAIETESVFADNVAQCTSPESGDDPYADLEHVPQARAYNAENSSVPTPNHSPTIQQRAQRAAPTAGPTLQGAVRTLEDSIVADEPSAVVPEEVPVRLGPKPAVKPASGPSEGTALRGSLADSVAKTVTVSQTVHESPNKAGGVKRI